METFLFKSGDVLRFKTKKEGHGCVVILKCNDANEKYMKHYDIYLSKSGKFEKFNMYYIHHNLEKV